MVAVRFRGRTPTGLFSGRQWHLGAAYAAAVRAEPAAEAAEFAGAHHKFWEMHDLLYENQDRLDDALLFQLAQQLHLDPEKLRQALASKEFEPRVRADFRGGVRCLRSDRLR